jgi:hypothetical protein
MGLLRTQQTAQQLRLLSRLSRGARIRTGDPLLPKQVRYRTAPRPVSCSGVTGYTAYLQAPNAKLCQR